jgi:hypothetical protein
MGSRELVCACGKTALIACSTLFHGEIAQKLSLCHGGPNAGSGFRQRSMRFTDRMRIGRQKRTRTRSGRAGSAGSMRNSTWPGTRICADRIPDLRLAYLTILVLYSISLSLICCWPAKLGPSCTLSLMFSGHPDPRCTAHMRNCGDPQSC